MTNNAYKIGIVGTGMVGGALKRYYESIGQKTFIYDKYKNLGSPKELNEADLIFICVPTPYSFEYGCDLSFIKDALSFIKGSKTIVIKSTILPGTTEIFQKKYLQHRFLFNPEFLSEATADDDMSNPDIQVVGFTIQSRFIAEDVLKTLPKAPFEKIMPATEAEMVKYFHNTHGTVKVSFANQMHDLCEALNVNYENVMQCAVKTKNIQITNYLHVWHKGFRGYGGTCFPKDIRALIWLGDNLGVDLKIHKAAEEVNNKLMEKQNISDPESMGRSWSILN